MLMQFLIELERAVMFTTPLVIGWFALRRLVLSRSFNRVLYALALGQAALAFMVAIGTRDADPLLHAIGHLYAYSPLFFWACVLAAAPSTRGNSAYGDDYAPDPVAKPA